MISLTNVKWLPAISPKVTFYEPGTLIMLKSGEIMLLGDLEAKTENCGGCGCCSYDTDEYFGEVIKYSIIYTHSLDCS